MTNYSDKQREIRERWFKNHKATLTQHGDLQGLEWRQPGTTTYSCRYVFDGNNVYISGDIGEAVFCLTWKATIHSFDDVHINCFYEKLVAYSGNLMDYNSIKASQRLLEWKQDLDNDCIEYDENEMRYLIQVAKNCSSKEEWAYEHVNNTYHDFIYDLDQDCWEWIYNIGDEIPWRIHAYLVGLQMASEQLKVN
jgi:hypothetical protein